MLRNNVRLYKGGQGFLLENTMREEKWQHNLSEIETASFKQFCYVNLLRESDRLMFVFENIDELVDQCLNEDATRRCAKNIHK